MKRILVFFTAIILIVLMVIPMNAADRGKALIVHGNDGDMLEGDQAVADHLTSYGFTVDAAFAPNTDESSWQGYDLVFIGESVTSADVATKFTLADCLVIIGEPGLMDEMLVGEYDSQYDSTNIYSTGGYNVVNDIIGCGLKKFEGFTSEDVIPGFLLTWADDAKIIVQNDNGSPAITLFEPGCKLVDGSSAVNYRMQCFFRRQDAAVATADTWLVWEKVIDYVFPVPVIEEAVEAAPDEAAPETAAAAAVSVSAAQTMDMSIAALALAAISSAGIIISKRRK